MKKPIRVFYSELSGQFYATAHYRQLEDGGIVVTGAKHNVTSDIGAAVTRHEITFTEIGAGVTLPKLTCPKMPRGGYLHGEDDDSPYSVDGDLYCGRCHYAVNNRTRRCERLFQ